MEQQLRQEDAAVALAPAPSASTAIVGYGGFTDAHPGFMLSWETVVVASEILAALGTSLYLLYKKAKHDRSASSSSSSSSPRAIIPHNDPSQGTPITHLRSCCSLDALLYFRLVALAFYVVVQLYDLYRTRFLCMIFYTSWNFIAQGVYFAIAASRTFQARKLQRGARRGYAPLLDESKASGGGVPAVTASRTAHRGWIRLELALDVCLATSILISVVVWTILYPYAVKAHIPEKILNWVSYCQHAINLVFLQIDFLSTHHVVSFHALPLLIAWPSVYSVFTWLLHGTVAKGFWPYPFMEVNTPYAPLWYAGLLFAHVIGFALVYAISRWKVSSSHGELTMELSEAS